MKRLVLLLALSACSHTSEPIGVAECDAYESKMAACAAQVGGNVGEQLDKLRTAMHRVWVRNRRDPELPGECRALTADMQLQLPQCAW